MSAQKTAIEVEIDYLSKEFADFRDITRSDIKELSKKIEPMADSLARIESLLISQQATCNMRGDQLKSHDETISNLKISDARQGDSIQDLKNFAAKWGPFLTVAAYILLDKVK